MILDDEDYGEHWITARRDKATGAHKARATANCGGDIRGRSIGSKSGAGAWGQTEPGFPLAAAVSQGLAGERVRDDSAGAGEDH